MTKRILSVILCIVILLTVVMSVPITASAADYNFEIDGVRYAEIDEQSVEVVGYNSSVLPEDLVVPATVEGKNVTRIAFPGFSDAKIKSVVLPETLTEIDRYGFHSCSRLAKFTSLGGLTYIRSYAFQGCFALKELNLPDSLVAIDSEAFLTCKSLESFKFPKNFEHIGSGAFRGCVSLKEVTINSTMQTIGTGAFKDLASLKKVIFEERTTPITIGFSAFKNCRGLTDFDFSCVGSIQHEGFADCTGFTSIVLPEDANITLDAGAFKGCSNIKTVKFPDYINKIPDSCFADCTSLESIETADLIEIGNYAFSNCARLKDISFAKYNNLSWIGSKAFYNCELISEISLDKAKSVLSSAFENCYNLSKVTFGENLDSIGEKAFYNCYHLTEVYLPCIGYINEQAFENCYNLSKVTLIGGLKTIGERAFFNCFSLYDIYIPKTVEYIGSMALGCFEDEGQYYIYTDFTVLGDPDSLADEYAEAYKMQYALPDVQLSSIENTADGIKITFEKLSGVSGYYRVYRKTADTSWSKLADVTTASYTDKTAEAGIYYIYTVKFVGNDGTESRYDKNGLSITRLLTPTVTDIANTNDGVKLTISEVKGATYYRVYYKTSDGWKGIDNTDTTTFVHDSAQSGETYTYTVKAFDKYDSSSSFDSKGFTNQYIATPEITAVSSTKDGVKISWNKVTGAVNYRVYIKTSTGWKGLGNTTSDTFTDTSATSRGRYTYTVRCMTKDGKTAVSGYDKEGKSCTVFSRAPEKEMIDSINKIQRPDRAEKSPSALKPQPIKKLSVKLDLKLLVAKIKLQLQNVPKK